ncbi:MAG: hypothetical protein N2247_00820 [Leptospiraceae bacterium]|nr:hypothetical protein [Leptospiraceae bacterium]
MKKYICFLICIISFQLNANEIAPILTEKIEEFIIGKELYLYEDKTHQETIETIKTKISEFKNPIKKFPILVIPAALIGFILKSKILQIKINKY